jgi:uncharacterized protein YjbI with pentapeptide repeats
MRWFTKHLGNAGMTGVSVLFLLTCLALIPLEAASAHEKTSGVTTPTTATVQATPTEDATVTALSKEQLTQQVIEQQHTWDNWLWSNAATILSSFLSTLVIVIGALFGLWRWRKDRQDAQDKELKKRQHELEKRAEERFQAAVTGLGDEKEGTRIGAAILLRTFLRPGYEQFYMQTFDLAVAHLRLLRTSGAPESPDAPLPLTTLNQALVVAFKEAYPLARDRLKKEKDFEFHSQSLDASHIRLDNAYLYDADMDGAWMPGASLQKADLSHAKLGGADLSGATLSHAKLGRADLYMAELSEANLSGADLRWTKLNGASLNGANLSKADLNKADLSRAILSIDDPIWTDLSRASLHGANLSEADLREAIFSRADLNEADLSRADLRWANLREVCNLESALSLKDTDLRGVEGLTKEQLATCKAKGAIIDEDPTTSPFHSTVPSSAPPPNKDTQAPLAPSAQERMPFSGSDRSNTASSKPEPES